MSTNPDEGSFNPPDIAALNALYTGQEVDLVSLMTTYYQSKRPTWTPNTANVETMLFEVMALVLNLEVTAINNVPYTLARQLMAYEGVYNDDGAKASTRIRFDVTPSLNTVTIPAGTRLRLTLDDSVGEALDLITEEPVTIYPETNTGYATALAEEVGAGANGTPAGTHLGIVDNLPLVESAILYTPVLGGRDPETEEQFAARAEAARASLSASLVSPENFKNYASRDPAVGRAHVLDRYDPEEPSITATGHVTIAVMDQSGQPLTEEQQAELLTNLRDRALSSLAIHVLSPTYTTVNIDAVIRVRTGYDESIVTAAAQDAITAFLDPLTWDWSPHVSANQLVGVLTNVPGIAEVISVPETIPLTTPAPAPRPGTITITAQTN